MRAVWMKQFGGPEVLVAADAPDPEPGFGQVVVDVAHANITFVETQFRATGAGPFAAELPMIPGNGVAGTVASTGPGVDPALVGARVVTSTGGSGGYAERVAVDAGALIAVPDGLALDTALALLADGRTATMLVRAARIGIGDRVLVEAAGGGVGTLLVQLAVRADAIVVAAAGGTRKLDVARDVGAQMVVDYLDDGWAGHVRDAVGGVDVVFDGVGGAVSRSAFELLDRGGRMLIYGLASGAWTDVTDAEAAQRGITLVRGPFATPDELRAFTEGALVEAAEGRLHPLIGQRFPLERAADAHAAIESRATIGKTLLDVAPGASMTGGSPQSTNHMRRALPGGSVARE